MKKLSVMIMVSLLFVLGACGKDEKKEEPKKEETKEELKANGVYELPLNPTDTQYDLYQALSKALSSDDEAVAKAVAQNFAADFFTLKNKKSAEEVGGLTYLPEAKREEFKIFAMNYVYANYQTIISDHGKENLPEVKKVSVDSIEPTTDTLVIVDEETLEELSEEYEGYTVTLTIEYASTKVNEDELKTTATFTILDIDGRLEIIKMA